MSSTPNTEHNRKNRSGASIISMRRINYKHMAASSQAKCVKSQCRSVLNLHAADTLMKPSGVPVQEDKYKRHLLICNPYFTVILKRCQGNSLQGHENCSKDNRKSLPRQFSTSDTIQLLYSMTSQYTLTAIM